MKTVLKVLGIVLLMVLVGAIGLLGYVIYETSGHVVLENGSNEVIVVCNIELPGHNSKFENIAPGSERGFWYSPSHDGEYHVTVTFASGKKLVDDVGYVTPNFGNRDRLIITHDLVKLIQDRYPGLASVSRHK